MVKINSHLHYMALSAPQLCVGWKRMFPQPTYTHQHTHTLGPDKRCIWAAVELTTCTGTSGHLASLLYCAPNHRAKKPSTCSMHQRLLRSPELHRVCSVHVQCVVLEQYVHTFSMFAYTYTFALHG